MSESSHVVADPLGLLGFWTLERVIEDRREQRRHRVDGVLELTVVEPDRILWRETGRWHQQSGDVEVSRSLWLQRLSREPCDRWQVRFEDGRDFHAWAPGREVSHDCSPDTYRGMVEGSTDRWSVRWDVTGPDKDYTMTTVLTRAE